MLKINVATVLNVGKGRACKKLINKLLVQICAIHIQDLFPRKRAGTDGASTS